MICTRCGKEFEHFPRARGCCKECKKLTSFEWKTRMTAPSERFSQARYSRNIQKYLREEGAVNSRPVMDAIKTHREGKLPRRGGY